MKSRKYLLCLLCCLLPAVSATAQFVQSPSDDLAADTVDLVVAVAPDAAQTEWHLQLDLYLYADGNNIMTTNTGFVWDNPNLQMDSCIVEPTIQATFDFVIATFPGMDINKTNEGHEFQFTALSKTAPCLVPQPERRRLASYYFTLSDWSVGDSIVIDTCWFSPATRFFIYRLYPSGEYVPYWTGGKVIYDTPSTCCVQRTGDANCSGGDEPTIGDLNRLVDFLYGSQTPLCCIPEADVNQSGGAEPTTADVTIGDISYLQDYLFITGSSLGLPDCL